MSEQEVTLDLSEADDDYQPEPIDWEGIDEAEVDEAIEEAVPKVKPKVAFPPGFIEEVGRVRTLDFDGLFDLPPITWFIEDLIPAVPRTMVQGQGGTYKSFLVLDWMLCAATGRSWHGRHIEPGKVMYMAGEGARGLPKRITAWLAQIDERQRPEVLARLKRNVTFMADPLQFFQLAKHEGKREVWRAYFDHFQPKYIVVDTLHMSSSGANENDNGEMGTLLNTATYVAGGTDGAQLIFVHHKGKEDRLGGRGASALRDDFDVTVDLVKSGDYLAELKPDKIRDAEAFKPLLVQFERYATEDSERSSLYIESVESKADHVGADGKAEKPSRVTEAMDAIIEHDLLKDGWGEVRTHQALKGLDLGYNFGHGTVGKAIKRLRETQVALETMRRNASGSDD